MTLSTPQCSNGTSQSRPFPARPVKIMESAGHQERRAARDGARFGKEQTATGRSRIFYCGIEFGEFTSLINSPSPVQLRIPLPNVATEAQRAQRQMNPRQSLSVTDGHGNSLSQAVALAGQWASPLGVLCASVAKPLFPAAALAIRTIAGWKRAFLRALHANLLTALASPRRENSLTPKLLNS